MKHSSNLLRALAARRATLSLTALLALGAAAQAETLQDPTRPATVKTIKQGVTAARLQLEAVMDSGVRRIAIVNGKVVRTGDRIAGAMIEEIRDDSIRYTRQGKSEIARLTKSAARVRESVTRKVKEAK